MKTSPDSWARGMAEHIIPAGELSPRQGESETAVRRIEQAIKLLAPSHEEEA